MTLVTLLKFSAVIGSDDGRRKKEAQGIKKPATLFSKLEGQLHSEMMCIVLEV